MQDKHDLKFEVLSDLNNVIAKEYGLLFSLEENCKKRYEPQDILEAIKNSSNKGV